MLDLFRELQVLGQTLNFTKAANLLHMSQSSLTRHIANLEATLGVRLFDRIPMRPTPEGQYFITATASRGLRPHREEVPRHGRRIPQ